MTAKGLCMATIALVMLATTAMVNAQAPTGTAFTYQGQLKKGGVPVAGTADLQFTLWDALAGGNQSGSMIPVNNKTVTNGLFTVTLDFGTGIFGGNARWLEIAVRSPAGSGGYTTLTPRQELTPAPYSIHSQNAASGWGSGSTNRIAKFLAGGTLGDSTIFESGGSVGVGTTSPNARLEVRGDNEAVRAAAGTDPTRYIQMRYHSSVGPLIEGDGYQRLTFDADVGAAGSIVLGQGGDNVGIGIIDPAYKLDVVGDVHATGTFYGTATSASSASNADMLDSQHGSFYQNASNLNAGTVARARLPQNSIGTAEIEDGSIMNVDVSASAAIAPSKISGTAWTYSTDGYPPRCDFAAYGGFLSTSGSYVTVTSVVVILPSSGFVTATASAQSDYWDGSYEAYFGIGFDSTTPSYYSERWLDMPDDARPLPVSATITAELAAGTRTIYFLARRNSGTGQVWFPRYSLSVIFVDNLGKMGIAQASSADAPMPNLPEFYPPSERARDTGGER